jgi:radical SAM superfamily enzyme YgiQ (UPF0313 family)
MKILFVQPSRIKNNGTIEKWKRHFNRSMALPYLAALTPPGIDVEIVDDRVEEINYNGNYDLVGITSYTSQAPRAYQIADLFRQKGRKVVMGGIHATALPDEAILHADAIVLGEAENVWGNLLADFKSGNLKQFYKSDTFHSLIDLPRPRFDLLNVKEYTLPFTPVQASRGCPHNCDFCSVSKFYGKSYRFRPVENVVEEIKASGAKNFIFIDDNITAHKKYSRELFKALIPLKIRWIGQCTTNIGRDPELCKLAAQSGCYFMGIGVESVDQENLQTVEKSWNKVAEFPKLLKTIRKSGIGLVLNMIVGLDNDDEGVFEKTRKFLMNNRAFYLVLNTPIPYPGTKLAERIEEEGRIIYRDWSKYVQGNVIFTPKQMTPEALKNGYWKLLDDFFSYPSIMKRSFYQSCRNIPFYLKRNIDLHLAVKRRDY